MTRYKSHEIFHQCETQARLTIGFYQRYKAGPAIEEQPGLTQLEIGYLVLSGIMTAALWFTVQAEIYINKGLMTMVLGARWLVGVMVVLAAGFFSSVILAEQLPLTRVLTAGTVAGAGFDAVDALVDKLRGVKRKTGSPGATLRRYGLIFIAFMIVLLSALAALQGAQTNNWLPAVFPPVLFLFDSIFGIGPVWLVVFSCNRIRIRRQNRLAEQRYADLETVWNLVAELYEAAKSRFFEEHPELAGKVEHLPAVHSLTAYIITHPCHRDVEIPGHLFGPDTPPPAAAPVVDPKDPAPDPIDGAKPIFSAMDSELDANNEKA